MPDLPLTTRLVAWVAGELFAAKLVRGPQIDFCRCFGDMDETGREIALYPPGY